MHKTKRTYGDRNLLDIANETPFIAGVTFLAFGLIGALATGFAGYGLLNLGNNIIESLESRKPENIRWANKETLSEIADSLRVIDLDGDITPELEAWIGGRKVVYKLDLRKYSDQEIDCYYRLVSE